MMKKLSRIITIILSLVLCATAIFAMSGCWTEKEEGYKKNPDLDTTKDISLTIATNRSTWVEMDEVCTKFEKIYPNCSVTCEYVENFVNNVEARLEQTTDKIDIFRTGNIQEASTLKDYTLNLISEDSKKILDLSGCNQGLVKNFQYLGAENTQYSIPFGGEMRGMYVNVTLLKKYNLEVPTNREELLHCCEVLYEAGYVPLQSSSGTFAQQLMYPMICNSIVNGGNYEEDYAAIENIDDGISEYFEDAITFLYDIVEKGYYDYKRVEEEGKFLFNSNETKALEFLNVLKKSDNVFEKVDDIGEIAFMPDTQAFEQYLSKAKSDYHSTIEYKFIVSPVGVDGGYAYLSPADGLAINKNSDNLDWALEFLNFFFYKDTNVAFAKASNKISNTSDGLIQFDIPESHVSDVGQMTFSYPFYKTITTLMMGGYNYNPGSGEGQDSDFDDEGEMIGISKMNAKKYMIDNGDGTYTLKHTVEEYMEKLEEEFQKIKATRVVE